MTRLTHVFTRFAVVVSEWTGKPAIFVLALCSVILWGATGPIFHYSDTWQLVINTSTTIVTFLMVFLLQNAQTRDTRAIQAKLNELILTSAAENRFVGIENLDEEDLKHLDRLVGKAAKRQQDQFEGKDEGRVEQSRVIVAKSASKRKRRRVSRAASTKEQSKTAASSRKPA
ncbi:low affinity iron permease family protein [Rhizobium lusitanum]|uniref:Low affinity iron permease family protein n=1 Tax=Rhizobium lusitanum TaxID=293958 RepID=A0A6L9UBR4_9HYPH|nr:low affinity iron permease family protein [Rhizobium lusitanum]NEI73054.1 low affinity iron permease family protein [Rhizobium lusitanum]